MGFGNKNTLEIIFTGQLAKIKCKGSFWKPIKLSLLGRIHVVNIFYYQGYGIAQKFCLFQSIFSINLYSRFCTAVMKHEVNKQLMSANVDQGRLKLVNIENKITSQGIVWLSKLSSMEQACFTRVVSEEQIGNFEAGYYVLDFLKTKPDCFPIHSNGRLFVIL